MHPNTMMQARLALALLIGIIATGCGTPPASARDAATSAAASTTVSEWQIPFTESFVIQSPAGQRDYQISVATPRGYAASTRKYPALYVLDANWSFPIAVETARLLAIGPKEHPDGDLKEQPVIVGIGYPVGLYWNAIPPRLRDFTPTSDVEFVRELSGTIGFPLESSGSGGAADFLDLLEKDVIPAVESRFRLDDHRRALFGHSLGGLFAVYVLFHHPELFESYVITSPALWWDRGVTWKDEQAFAREHDDLKARVFLTSGSLDDGHLPSTKKLDEVFRSRKYRGLVWQTEVFDGETHASVGAYSLSRGIRWLYGDLAPKS